MPHTTIKSYKVPKKIVVVIVWMIQLSFIDHQKVVVSKAFPIVSSIQQYHHRRRQQLPFSKTNPAFLYSSSYNKQQQQQRRRRKRYPTKQFQQIFVDKQYSQSFFSLSSNNNDDKSNDNANTNKNVYNYYGDEEEDSIDNLFLTMFDGDDPTSSLLLLDDEYCSVVTDDLGCEAYEEKIYKQERIVTDSNETATTTTTTINLEEISRFVRMEAKTDELLIKEKIANPGKVYDKIQQIKQIQSQYGNCELYPRKWKSKETTRQDTNTSDNHYFTVLQFNSLAEGLSCGPNVKTPFPPNNKNDDKYYQTKEKEKAMPEEKKDKKKSSKYYGGFTMIKNIDIVLDFSLRRWRLLEVILGGNIMGTTPNENKDVGTFDIIAMEEVDRFRSFFAPLLRLFHYEGLFIPKPNSPSIKLGYYSDGCSIFWNSKKFQFVSEKRLSYQKTGNNNQVLILCTLRHIESHKQFLLVVTHLKAQNSIVSEKIRCIQVNELLQLITHEVDNNDTEHNIDGVIILGDFNADAPSSKKKKTTPTTKKEKEEKERQVTEQQEEQESCITQLLNFNYTTTKNNCKTNLRFQSAYDIENTNATNFYTTWKTRGKNNTVQRIIDYIFYSSWNTHDKDRKEKQESLVCTDILEVPVLLPPETSVGKNESNSITTTTTTTTTTSNEKQKENDQENQHEEEIELLPCLRYPSDHVAIAARFKIQ